MDTRWLNMEKCQYPLPSILFIDSSRGNRKMDKSYFKNIKISLKINDSISPSSSINTLNTFIPSVLDTEFKKRSNNGLNFIYRFINKNNLKSFEQLVEESQLPKTDIYRYIQIGDCLTKHKELGECHQSE